VAIRVTIRIQGSEYGLRSVLGNMKILVGRLNSLSAFYCSYVITHCLSPYMFVRLHQLSDCGRFGDRAVYDDWKRLRGHLFSITRLCVQEAVAARCRGALVLWHIAGHSPVHHCTTHCMQARYNATTVYLSLLCLSIYLYVCTSQVRTVSKRANFSTFQTFPPPSIIGVASYGALGHVPPRLPTI